MNHARNAIAMTSLVAVVAFNFPGCSLFAPSAPEVINQTHTNSLAAGDTVNATDGSFQDDYTIRVEQGWTITATLSAPAFDPYVWILSPHRASAQQLASLPGAHAVTLTHTAETTGSFIVRANSNGTGQTGDYTLHIAAGPSGVALPLAPRVAVPPGPAAPAAHEGRELDRRLQHEPRPRRGSQLRSIPPAEQAEATPPGGRP